MNIKLLSQSSQTIKTITLNLIWCMAFYKPMWYMLIYPHPCVGSVLYFLFGLNPLCFLFFFILLIFQATMFLYFIAQSNYYVPLLVQLFGNPVYYPFNSPLLYLIDTLSLWPPAASPLHPSLSHTPVFQSLFHHYPSVAEHQLASPTHQRERIKDCSQLSMSFHSRTSVPQFVLPIAAFSFYHELFSWLSFLLPASPLFLRHLCFPDYLSKWGSKSLGGSIVTHGAYIDGAVYKWTQCGTAS